MKSRPPSKDAPTSVPAGLPARSNGKRPKASGKAAKAPRKGPRKTSRKGGLLDETTPKEDKFEEEIASGVRAKDATDPEGDDAPEDVPEDAQEDDPKGNGKNRRSRADPYRQRRLSLKIGSEHEVGGRLLEALQFEGDGQDVVYTNGVFLEYVAATGLWTEIQSVELKAIIGTFDGQEYPSGKQTRKLKVGPMLTKGAIDQAAVLSNKADFLSSKEPVLAFTNGVLRISTSGEVELLKHSPDSRVTLGYPFPWDPKAKCQRFEKMMEEHFDGDFDSKEKILCEQEFFGACLFGIATTYQKCLALPSDGGSGRSTLLETIEAAFPTGTVAHIDVKDLRSAERRTRLVGAKLNFSDEVPPDAFIESEDFKKVVTGNIITAEGKYRASFEYRPIAGHVFPIQTSASAELTTAFFRRFIIIRYNKSFEGDPKRDLHLTKKIVSEELPGIVRYLVEGCARLRTQGEYTIPPSHLKEVQQWRMESDNVMGFVGSACVRPTFQEPKDNKKISGSPGRHDWAYADDVYKSYRKWCEANGHNHPVASWRFGERLQKLGIVHKKTNKGMTYALTERTKAETREDIRTGKSREERHPLPGYFDTPLLSLIDGGKKPPVKS